MTALIIAALLTNGILSGLSLDKVIVQLPARRRIGPVGYAAFARAADLGNGIAFYALAGIGAAVVTIAAFVYALASSAPADTIALFAVAAALSMAHSAATAVAAPTMMRIGRSPDTDGVLAPLLSRFALASGIRAVLQVATFMTVLAVVAVEL
jgi:hypothetical protein